MPIDPYNAAAVRVRDAFAPACRGTYRAVCTDGNVRVYDPVAGYWTMCHSLTKSQRARVRRLATITPKEQK